MSTLAAKAKFAALQASTLVGGALDLPPLAYRFFVYLEVNNVIEAGFTQFSGLTMERQVDPYEEGGSNDYVHQLPGRFKQSRITLKRGVTFSPNLWDWFFQDEFAEELTVKKTNVSLIHFSSYSIAPVRWYHLENAYPAKWSISDFDAGSSQVSIETIELVYEKLQVESMTKLF